MNPLPCTCTESDLLLAFHRALPPAAWLKVQLHRLLCPVCRERYRQLSEVSRQLAGALNPHPVAASARPIVPLWGAVLFCTLAISAAAWSAQACFGIPVSRVPVCELAHPTPAPVERCEPSK